MSFSMQHGVPTPQGGRVVIDGLSAFSPSKEINTGAFSLQSVLEHSYEAGVDEDPMPSRQSQEPSVDEEMNTGAFTLQSVLEHSNEAGVDEDPLPSRQSQAPSADEELRFSSPSQQTAADEEFTVPGQRQAVVSDDELVDLSPQVSRQSQERTPDEKVFVHGQSHEVEDELMFATLSQDDDDGFTLSTTTEFRGAYTRCRVPTPNWRQTCAEQLQEWDIELLSNIPTWLAECYSARLQALELQQLDAEKRAAALEAVVKSQKTRSCCMQCLFYMKLCIVLALVVMIFTGKLSSARAPVEVPSVDDPFDNSCITPVDVAPEAAELSSAVLRQSYELCGKAIVHAEFETSELERIARRDILGYQQMMKSMLDWVTLARAQAASFSSGAPSKCLDVVLASYRQAVSNLNMTMLAEHDRVAALRSSLFAQRHKDHLR